jgi:hypothetical protein
MPSLLVKKPDDATPVRSVTKPIVIVFDPPGFVPVPDFVPEPPDEVHAARAVHAATTSTADRESRRRIGGPPPLFGQLERHAVGLSGRALKRYRNPNGNVNEMNLPVTERMPLRS